MITDRQDRLLIVRDNATETWRLPGGAADTAVSETPRETAERHALQGLGQSIALDQLLGIDWCRFPSRPAQVHYFYGAETPGCLRIDSVLCPQRGPSVRKFIRPAAASTFLSPQDTRRVHACLTARAAQTGPSNSPTVTPDPTSSYRGLAQVAPAPNPSSRHEAPAPPAPPPGSHQVGPYEDRRHPWLASSRTTD
ncbi:hypothetical protein [Streptomyces sp. SceaMP-e96]|uniref:hypothetical protein n=1 Tax=Streptomyces sp. SceaMP-e96 TaxID=1100824 RepID=UPI00406CD23F